MVFLKIDWFAFQVNLLYLSKIETNEENPNDVMLRSAQYDDHLL